MLPPPSQLGGYTSPAPAQAEALVQPSVLAFVVKVMPAGHETVPPQATVSGAAMHVHCTDKRVQGGDPGGAEVNKWVAVENQGLQ